MGGVGFSAPHGISWRHSLGCIQLVAGLGGKGQGNFIQVPGTPGFLYVASPRGQHGSYRVVGFLTWRLAFKGMKAKVTSLLRTSGGAATVSLPPHSAGQSKA